MGALIRAEWRPEPQRFPGRHADAASVHALRRLRQRYGARFTAANMDQHAHLIRSGACRKISGNGTRALFEVEDCGVTLLAIFDRRLDRIVTYLTASEDIGARRDQRARS